MKNNRILTVANAITFLGIVLAASSFIKGWQGDRVWFFWFFVLGALTDFLDGLAARLIEKHWPGWGISEFGKKLDPVRDKLLGLSLFPLANLAQTNWTLPAVIMFFEVFLVGFFSLKIKKKLGTVRINRFSRVISALQALLIIAAIFFAYIYPENFKIESFNTFLSAILVFTVSRIFVYGIDYAKLD